jgi:hypothetical protein
MLAQGYPQVPSAGNKHQVQTLAAGACGVPQLRRRPLACNSPNRPVIFSATSPGPGWPVPDVAGLRVHRRYMAGIPEVQLAAFLPRSSCCLGRIAGTSGDYGSCSSLKPLPCRRSRPPGALFPATVTAFPYWSRPGGFHVAPCLLGCRGIPRQRPVRAGTVVVRRPVHNGTPRHQAVL